MLRLFDSAVVRFARGCAAPAVRAARLHLCDDLLVFQGAIVQHIEAIFTPACSQILAISLSLTVSDGISSTAGYPMALKRLIVSAKADALRRSSRTVESCAAIENIHNGNSLLVFVFV